MFDRYVWLRGQFLFILTETLVCVFPGCVSATLYLVDMIMHEFQVANVHFRTSENITNSSPWSACKAPLWQLPAMCTRWSANHRQAIQNGPNMPDAGFCLVNLVHKCCSAARTKPFVESRASR
jgi:hypothetical protein